MDSSHSIHYLHLLPLLPFLGAAITLILGRRLSRPAVHFVAVGAVLAAALVALQAVLGDLLPLWHHRGSGVPAMSQTVFRWLHAGDFSLDLRLLLDPLSAVMILVVTIVGFFIHVYSMGYMAHDPDYPRFFGYLNLFTGSMLLLVLADSLPVMFVGWEGVGLCSYLLIGFWYDKDHNAFCGRKAFIVNRVGDFAFLLGVLLCFVTADTFSITELRAKADLFRAAAWLGMPLAFWVGLFLFIGATGKSAQLPLYVWLPDAMAGPTPVSALIHAATMVTAGVYLVARLAFIYVLSPHIMAVVALVGALTAFFAATIGFAQNDIKKVLAYSTVSQLGFMFAAVGVGAFTAGIFHLATHAFFKACLFLCAGSVMHAMGDRGDIREMGGLRRPLPITHATFLIATLAIVGIVPFSGFFSKGAILAGAFAAENPAFHRLGVTVYVLLLLSALGTAFYMFRLYFLVFSGTSRADPQVRMHVHESPQAMTIPLIVLASGATLLGFIGIAFAPRINLIAIWLGPVFAGVTEQHHLSLVTEFGLEMLALGIAGMGMYGAALLYKGGYRPLSRRLVLGLRWVHTLVFNKYYVDETYDVLIVRPLKALSHFCHKVIDVFLIDTLLVDGSAFLVDLAGRAARRLQSGDVQRYLVAVLVGLTFLVYVASKPSASFSAPERIRIGTPWQPDATALENSGRELEFFWDLEGKGSFAPLGPRPGPRTFDRPGTYRVALKVCDRRFGHMCAVAVRKVEVTP